jgi:hypothetical protein
MGHDEPAQNKEDVTLRPPARTSLFQARRHKNDRRSGSNEAPPPKILPGREPQSVLANSRTFWVGADSEFLRHPFRDPLFASKENYQNIFQLLQKKDSFLS